MKIQPMCLRSNNKQVAVYELCLKESNFRNDMSDLICLFHLEMNTATQTNNIKNQTSFFNNVFKVYIQAVSDCAQFYQSWLLFFQQSYN